MLRIGVNINQESLCKVLQLRVNIYMLRVMFTCSVCKVSQLRVNSQDFGTHSSFLANSFWFRSNRCKHKQRVAV
jgi:hypothetical protein